MFYDIYKLCICSFEQTEFTVRIIAGFFNIFYVYNILQNLKFMYI